MTTARIVASLWAAGLRSSLEHRADFVLETLMGLVRQGVGFALMWVILGRFETIAGWTLGEVAFLYGLRLTMLARVLIIDSLSTAVGGLFGVSALTTYVESAAGARTGLAAIVTGLCFVLALAETMRHGSRCARAAGLVRSRSTR